MKRHTMGLIVALLAPVWAFAESAAPAASPEAVNPIAVGEKIPDVSVQNAKGEDVNLRALVAEKPTALIFYRGGWCPFCNKHLAEVASIQDEIVKRGYQIVAISTDRPEDVATVEKKGSYPYTILSDSTVAAATAFGVAFKLDEPTATKYAGYGIKLMDTEGTVHNSLPVPAFYLIGTDGTVLFEHHDPDYKVRMKKDEILKAMDDAKSKS